MTATWVDLFQKKFNNFRRNNFHLNAKLIIPLCAELISAEITFDKGSFFYSAVNRIEPDVKSKYENKCWDNRMVLGCIIETLIHIYIFYS